MLTADSHFLIGYTHYVCEDYALSGIGQNQKFQYAIVADGCSASKDVDIGARILAKCAVDVLDALFDPAIPPHDLYVDIGKATIENAQRVIQELNLSKCSLDATLLIAIATETETYVLMYGDGAVLFKHNGNTMLHEVEFPSGAPYYLSYWLDENRRGSYFVHGDRYNLILWMNGVPYKESLHIIDYPPYFVQGKHDIVAVMSDGVSTYHDSRTSIDFTESALALLDFKNTNGLFVKRRMGALKRKHDRLGIVHDDDVSMAVIHRSEGADE